MIDLYIIFIAIFTFAIAYIIHAILVSGWLSKIEPILTDSPKFLSKPLTVYYKHRVGEYSGTGTLLKELDGIMPSQSTNFGIFYDNPEDVPGHLCQSVVGVVFGEDGNDYYADNYAQQLISWGYEKMVLPKVEKVVQAIQPRRNILSLFALIYRTYDIVNKYLEEKELSDERKMSLEFYAPGEFCLLFPFGDCKDLIVPQVKTREQLESELARKHFDSDLSDSESEPEGDEEEEENADD